MKRFFFLPLDAGLKARTTRASGYTNPGTAVADRRLEQTRPTRLVDSGQESSLSHFGTESRKNLLVCNSPAFLRIECGIGPAPAGARHETEFPFPQPSGSLARRHLHRGTQRRVVPPLRGNVCRVPR